MPSGRSPCDSSRCTRRAISSHSSPVLRAQTSWSGVGAAKRTSTSSSASAAGSIQAPSPTGPAPRSSSTKFRVWACRSSAPNRVSSATSTDATPLDARVSRSRSCAASQAWASAIRKDVSRALRERSSSSHSSDAERSAAGSPLRLQLRAGLVQRFDGPRAGRRADLAPQLPPRRVATGHGGAALLQSSRQARQPFLQLLLREASVGDAPEQRRAARRLRAEGVHPGLQPDGRLPGPPRAPGDELRPEQHARGCARAAGGVSCRLAPRLIRINPPLRTARRHGAHSTAEI